MKFKVLTKDQILISLDRLTRFKNTKTKYLRVFSDILVSNMLEPKLKRSEIETLDYKFVTNCVSEIFNKSLNSESKDLSINNLIKEYENKIFKNSDDVQDFLDNTIDYKSAIELITDDSPINLKWLKSLNRIDSFDKMVVNRNKKSLKFPIEKVLLVEGITEEILLPAFSKVLGYDFYTNGIQVIPAGGKNQVVKSYYELSEELKIPIFILLDKDAEENIQQIKPKLRKQDKIHLVSCGEFEDLLPKSLIVKTVNSHFKNFLMISESELSANIPTAKVLEELFKTKGLHEFKKAEFAKLVRDMIVEKTDISPEIIDIIEEIK